VGRVWIVEQKGPHLHRQCHITCDEFTHGDRDPNAWWMDLLNFYDRAWRTATSTSSREGEVEQIRPLSIRTKSVSYQLSIGLVLALTICTNAAGLAQMSSTETEIWSEGNAHIQLPSHLRVLAFTGLEQGIGFPFQQWYSAVALGYQFKPILREHLLNIDPDKDHYLVIGGGYEFFRTAQSGIVHHENRITIDGTPGFRVSSRVLLRDRNWLELRWVDRKYSTTYRNSVTVERDFLVHDFRFTPYGSAEVFYDGPKHSWDQEWYTGGIQLPFKRRFMVETYYRREHCKTCTPVNWNAAGMTLNFYFGNPK